MTDKFNIFRVYQENHPESLDFKPPVRQSAPEINFAPKTVLHVPTPTVSKPDSVAPLIDEMAGQIDATEQINRVTDINEMIRVGNFPAAEWLLGRKLTMEELREKMVRDLMKAPEKLEQQLRAEIAREKKKAEILKKIQDEEARQNALLNPAPNPNPVPQAPPLGPPGGAPATPQKQPGAPQPPQAPVKPPAAPPLPQPSAQATNTEFYLDDMAKVGIDAVSAVQLLMSDAAAAATELLNQGVPSSDIPELLISHALARYEQLHAPAGSSSSSSGPPVYKSANDSVTQGIAPFARKWADLNLDNTGMGIDDALKADPADFGRALMSAGLSQTDIDDMTDMQQVLRNDLGFGSSVPPVPAGPAPAPAPAGAIFTMPAMSTDAEKLASSQMMAASFALTNDPKGGLTPQQVYDARKLYKQYTAAVKADYDATIGNVNSPADRVKKAFRTNYSGFKDIASSKANKPDLGKVVARLDDEAANKLQEITANALKFGIKTGTGLHTRQMRAEWAPFGDKFLINMDKFKRGIFALGYATTRQPPQWSRGGVNLTKPLRNVIQDFLDGEPLDLSELDEQERAWVTHVWTSAKITKGKVPSYGMMKTKLLRSKEDMAERIDLLLGVQAAGNDNPLILKELKQLKDKMADRGWISPADLKKLEQLIALGNLA